MGILQFLGLVPSKTSIRCPKEQKRVDKACQKLQFYYFTACPFCFRVKRSIHFLQLNIQSHNIVDDLEKDHELRTWGGKSQVPCLRIEHSKSNIQWMYESADIVVYLKSQFSPEK